MKNRTVYFKEYYLANKPGPEMRKLLAEANREKRAIQQKAYRDQLKAATALDRRTLEYKLSINK